MLSEDVCGFATLADRQSLSILGSDDDEYLNVLGTCTALQGQCGQHGREKQENPNLLTMTTGLLLPTVTMWLLPYCSQP